jgi:Fe-S-cluster containining protein
VPSEDLATGPTFAEMLEANDLLEASSLAIRGVISHFEETVAEHARVHLTVVSCYNCTAKKGCCHFKTEAYLHEAVVIVARLKRENRDTPELRAELKRAAHAMETVPRSKHFTPCVFLGSDERCTIYEDRPLNCGMHFVSSPAENCSGNKAGTIDKILADNQGEIPAEIESQFVAQAGLRRIERQYVGALPRMVLICLEAWDRRDYVPFLAERCLPAAHRFAQIVRDR